MRRRDRQSSSPKVKEESIRQGKAKLTDLCPADKSKIGELVKKLASETKLRQDSESRFASEKMTIENKLREMEQ